MPLTPDDVSSKRFTPVRLREGYEMGEVDQFLDEIEAELQRLISENEDLRAQTSSGGADGASTAGTSRSDQDDDNDDKDESDENRSAAGAGSTRPSRSGRTAEHAGTAAEPEQADAGRGEEIIVTTSSDASRAATRLLELATHNAEQLVDEARREADVILEDVKGEAQEITSNAQRRQHDLDTETEARRESMMSTLEQERQQLDGRVKNLRHFEQTYRSSLATYVAAQLEQITSARIEPEGAPDVQDSSGATGSTGTNGGPGAVDMSKPQD